MEQMTMTSAPKKQNGILKWILIISIVVVLNLFYYVALRTVYPEPKYDNFCKNEQVSIQPGNQTECLAKGGQWSESITPKTVDMSSTVITKSGSCDVQFTCRQKFDDARKTYERNAFVTLIVVGIVTLVIGLVAVAIPVLSLGLSLGGVVTLVTSSMRFWESIDDYVRLLILALALGALIWIGIKKFQD